MDDIEDAVAAGMSDILSALGIEPIDIDIDLIKQTALSVIGALLARVNELEAESLDLISEIVAVDCRDYVRGEYQTQSLANQELIDRLVAAGRMRHKRDDHKGRPIYEFVVSAGRTQEAPAP